MKHNPESQPRLRRAAITVLCIFVLLAAGFCIYVSGSYEAAPEAQVLLESGGSGRVQIFREDDRLIVATPEEPEAGLILYPGGKVEPEAYVPLTDALAQQGILCVLVKMPCNLAVFDADAADGIAEQFPEIKRWYIGGHSLGGAMAASYAAGHAEKLEGLLLLAAYSTEDLSGTDLRALSLYGSEDGVLNREKYGECRKNLPADTQENVIEGGCHAYFGMYGEQEGDGKALIAPKEQIEETARLAAEWIKKGKTG